jgi:hypothetical protein
LPLSSKSPLPIEAPPMRSMHAPDSEPDHVPLADPEFAGLADDLVLEPPRAAPETSRPDTTPVGSDLAQALDRLLEEHLEDRPTEVVRMSKPTTPSDYQQVDGSKVIGRLPLKRRISDKS